MSNQPGPRVSIGQCSIAGQKSRNDDSYGVVVPEPPLLATKGIAMAIADGMSSSEGAKEASENCVKSFLGDYYATHATWTVKKSVGVVLRAVNSWLYAQGQSLHLSERGMVSTFSGIVLKSGAAYIFHAGDSRIARLRGDKLEALTRDHRVRVARGHEHLARAFGIDQNLEIDYREETVEAGDVLIFTTDGVHDHLTPAEQIRIIIDARGDLEAAARRIVDAALSKGSGDNLTCQLVRMDDVGRVDEATHLRTLTALPFPPELAPGKTFDGYTVLSELHASKRTQVYLARDNGTGKSVVLKTPSVNFEDDPEYIEMFAREEWIGALINSPNVLAVVAAKRPRRHLYYVVEHFDGQTLRQWMRDNPTPRLDSVNTIVEQIAIGLRAFHRKDVLHQDLKPENIMIDSTGHVKIIDFGSARAASLDEIGALTKMPNLVGTVDYTAPEYHLGEPPTNRADIYALGAITYEMLTGKLPYGRGYASARDVPRLEYVPASGVRPDIPIWVDAALRKAVEKRPANRTEALSALTADLRQPNTLLGYDRPRPLIERSPVAVWRALALALALLNLLLVILLVRQR